MEKPIMPTGTKLFDLVLIASAIVILTFGFVS